DSGPDRVERLEPGEEVGLLRAGARQRLVEVVVGIDEPGRDESAREVDPLVRVGRLSASDRLDQPAVEEHPAVRVLRAGVVQGRHVRVREQQTAHPATVSSAAVALVPADSVELDALMALFNGAYSDYF